jgi:hypothetical protein
VADQVIKKVIVDQCCSVKPIPGTWKQKRIRDTQLLANRWLEHVGTQEHQRNGTCSIRTSDGFSTTLRETGSLKRDQGLDEKTSNKPQFADAVDIRAVLHKPLMEHTLQFLDLSLQILFIYTYISASHIFFHLHDQLGFIKKFLEMGLASFIQCISTEFVTGSPRDENPNFTIPTSKTPACYRVAVPKAPNFFLCRTFGVFSSRMRQ